MPETKEQDASVQNPQLATVRPPFYPRRIKKPRVSFNKLMQSSYFRIGLTFFLLILLFLTASFIAFQSEQKRKRLQDYEKQIPKAEIIIPESNDVSIENWKSYTDEEYGFSFKYPQELEFNSCPDSLCGIFTEGLSNNETIRLEGFSYDCGVAPNPSFVNAENAAICHCLASGPAADISCETPTEEKKVAITSGINGFSFVLNELENGKFSRTKGPYTVIFFPRPILFDLGLYFEILDKNFIPELDQILSTLRFNSGQ